MSRIERDAGVLVDVPDDEPQRDLQRRGKGDAALLALVDIVFRRLELVAHEFELRALGEIADRKHRSEDLLQPDIGALFAGFRPSAESDRRSFSGPRSGSASAQPRGRVQSSCGCASCRQGMPCSSLWAAAGRPDLVSSSQSEPRHRSAAPIAIRPPRRRRPIPAQPPPGRRSHRATCRRQNRRARRIAPRFQISGVGQRRPVVGRRPSEIARSRPTLFRPSHPHLQAVS